MIVSSSGFSNYFPEASLIFVFGFYFESTLGETISGNNNYLYWFLLDNLIV